MGVHERLSLEAVSAETLIASEHVHRYAFASTLCEGLRVLDLACGTGYGSVILSETAESVTGVDVDRATIEMASATVGAEHGIEFQAADAAEFVSGDLAERFDAIVCFEGLEHFRDPEGVLEAMARHAAAGVRLIVSVPNSRAFEEQNEFHVTDYGYEDARAAFERFGEVTLLFQYLAEGSLIRSDGGAPPAPPELVLDDHGEPEWANHFIACVNLSAALREPAASARMRLAIAPLHNRYVRDLERANRELWRENTRLAQERIGVYGSSAVRLNERLHELEEQIRHLEGRLAAPRHRFVDRVRDGIRKLPLLDRVARSAGRRVS